MEKRFSLPLTCALVFMGAGRSPAFASDAVHRKDWLPCRLLFIDDDSLRPSKLVWTRRVDAHSYVSDQGETNTCYLYPAATFLDLALRKKGLLGGAENVSMDFFLAKNAERVVLGGGNIEDRLFPGTGAFLPSIAPSFLKRGVFTLEQYRLPRLARDLINDQEKTHQLERKISRFKSNKKRMELFREYFGDLPTEPRISPSRLQSTQLLDAGMFESAKIERIDDTNRAKPGELKRVLGVIKEQLDLGLPPIDASFATYPEFQSNIGDIFGNMAFSKGYNRIVAPGEAIGRVPPRHRIDRLNHSMAIVGYELDANGEVRHLLIRNNWGIAWGENGFFSADLRFIEDFLNWVTVLKPSAIKTIFKNP